MIDERLERLMDDVLDNSATAAEAAHLDTVLARDPEARARFEELQGMYRVLAEVPEETPPSDLRTAVINELRVSSSYRARPAPAFAGARNGLVRLAFAFVSGAVVTALLGVFALAGWPRVAGSPLPFEGTMLPPRAPAVSTPLQLDAPGAHLGAQVSMEEHALRVDMDFSGTTNGVSIRVDPRVLKPTTVRWSGGPSGQITTDVDGVQLHPVGTVHYQVWFETEGPGSAALQVQMATNEGLRTGSLLCGTMSGKSQR
jgi:hypothetical protein